MSCIAIDCRFATSTAGLGTFTRGIVPPLVRELSGHHVCLLVSSQKEDWLRDIGSHVTTCEVPATHYSVSEQLVIPQRLRQLSADLFYCPHFNVPLFCPVPFVTTIHDLTLHKYPNSASLIKQIAYRFLMRHAVKHAAAVTAVSESTARDIQNTYGRESVVIPEGFDSQFCPMPEEEMKAVLSKYGLFGGYLLYVGGSAEHKNLQVLLDAYEVSGTETPLVLVSNGKRLRKLRVPSNVSILHGVPHCDLPAIYNGAQCFVTASLYEGFCLPALEARACGTPVIATNVSAIPEVAGAHALLCEPTVTALSAAFASPPTECDPPEEKYSWEQAAKHVSAILLSQLHG